MKPAAFDYVRAESVEEALDALAEAGEDGRVIAGGQSLGPMLNLRLATPGVLIDVSRTPGLDRIEWSDDGLMLAAGATQARCLAEAELKRRQPLLAEAMPWIGHVQTRARGTVCGSLAHADPAAELPLLLAVMGGVVIAQSKRGQRGVKPDAFFAGMFETALAPDELLLAVRFDAPPPGAGTAFLEIAERHGDFALVAVAALADGAGVTLGVGGVEDKPVVKRWDGLDMAGAADAIAAFAETLDARDDPRADGGYRKRLVRKLGARAIDAAMERRHAV